MKEIREKENEGDKGERKVYICITMFQNAT